jgi:hypothetical protein
VGNHVPSPKLSMRKKSFLEFKGRLENLIIKLTSHFFSLPLSNSRCYPPLLGINRGDHSKYPTMNTMIIMMIVSTHGNLTSPLKMHLSFFIRKSHHIQSTQSFGDGGPTSS